ncbi:MAG: glycosyltransferase, partial [Ilumatobacteraceae bacterium]
MLPTTNETAAGRPRITFAIPYYSNSGYLLEAIRSVQAQTVDDWDVIVVDDAGPEPIVGVIAELGDPRIRSVRNDVNLGLAANWNRCIQLASAALVTLLHADDRLAPGYAAAVLAAAERDPELAAIFTDATIIGTDGLGARSLPDAMKRLARRPAHDHDVQGDDGLASMLANNYVFCPTLCYRTASLVDHPFADRWRMVMDLDHTAQMLLHGLRLHGVRAPLYEYRRHDSNQTSSLTASAIRFEEELALYRQLATAARRIGWLRSARTADRRLMVRSHLALQALVDLAG